LGSTLALAAAATPSVAIASQGPQTPGNLPPPSIRFDRITIADGLSFSKVDAMLQDRQGFLWVGTERGLNKYDGYQFTVYRNDPADPGSLSHDRIYALYEDSAGELWVGTAVGGWAKACAWVRRWVGSELALRWAERALGLRWVAAVCVSPWAGWVCWWPLAAQETGSQWAQRRWWSQSPVVAQQSAERRRHHRQLRQARGIVSTVQPSWHS